MIWSVNFHSCILPEKKSGKASETRSYQKNQNPYRDPNSKCYFSLLISIHFFVGFENFRHGETITRNCWPVLFFSSPPSTRMCIRCCMEKSVYNHKGKLKPPVMEQWESLFSIAKKFFESFCFASGGCFSSFSTWFSSTPSLTSLNWIALSFLMR